MIRLHDYWRSSAAYRVRIALATKGLGHEAIPHDLRLGEQKAPAYRALHPQGLVPALEIDGEILIQSSAILEWLEETHPDPPLLPEGTNARAIVRGMAALIGCDVHPLNNLRVLTSLREDLGASETQVSAWITRWIGDGFTALERILERHGGRFAYGDRPGLADIYLVPQLYSARRYGVDLTPYSRIVAAGDAAAALPAFRQSHPDRQRDAPS